MRLFCLTIVLTLLNYCARAQTFIDILQHTKPDTTKGVKRPLYHNISGYITDIENGQPIQDANIMFDTLKFVGTATDSTGLFILKNVPLGHHNIKVTHVNYEPTILSVQVNVAKSKSLDFRMKPRIIPLDAVEVKGQKDDNEAQQVSTTVIDTDEWNRIAGTRGGTFDGVVRSSTGIQSADDSRNDLIVRGNSSQSVLWRLEGASIPNPNHFALPGTSGGPVTIINGQMLSNSSFLSGAFPARYGNTTSGIFDLNFRAGDSTNYYHGAEFGLMGISGTSEGPLSSRKRSSYLVSARVSAAQVFTAMNMDIGIQSTPKYIDGSFNFNFPTKDHGVVKLFGMGGHSDIDILLSKQTDPSSNIYGEKDRDQYFSTDMAVIGLNYFKPLRSKEAKLSMTLAGSTQLFDSYHEFVYPEDVKYALKAQPGSNDGFPPVQRYRFRESKLSTALNYSKLVLDDTIKKRKAYLESGLTADVYFLSYYDSARNVSVEIDDEKFGQWRKRWWRKSIGLLLQPYLQYKYLFPKVDLTAGLHAQWFTLSNSISWIEPRIAFRYSILETTSLTAGFGLHSQIQQPNIYYYGSYNDLEGNPILMNKYLDFTRSMHSVVGLERKFVVKSTIFQLKTEVYFQHLYNIPIDVSPSAFSLINAGADYTRTLPDSLLLNNGIGSNYGVEVTIEKTFSKNYLFFLTGSLFESRYKGSDGVWRDTDFNGNYTLNAVFSYERTIDASKRRFLTIGVKYTSTGGRRYGEVDSVTSVTEKDVRYYKSTENTLQFSSYHRLDIKIGFRFNRPRATHDVGVDFMNVLNINNVLQKSYIPYVPSGGTVRTEYQLGFLPFFYYRFEFASGKRNGTTSRRSPRERVVIEQ